MAKREKKISAAELSCFCSEVALMLSAGMPLYEGMEALAKTYENSSFAKQYEAVSENVTQTGSLYEALKADECWPEYLVEMAGIGERTGRLEEVMQSLSVYFERESRVRKAVISAITYPMVLCVMMVLIVLVMILKVLPVFHQVLAGMGVALTSAGQMLTNIGTGAGWTIMALVGAIVIFVLVVLALLATKKRDNVLKGLRAAFGPVRKISAKLASSRAASVLSMMISGGYPLEESLELVPAVLSDNLAITKINTLRGKVNEGVPFSQALNESELFDEMYNRMIQVGSNTGREDEVMAKVAEIYEEQVETDIGNLVAIIEPTLIALLSVVIGAILLSVMLPMAGIISSIL